MRTIKFRGLRLDGKGWAYGNYFEKIKPTEIEDVFWCCFIQDKAISMQKVDRDSVGQYLDIKNKKGINLDWWEGDILTYPSEENESKCVIVYDDASFKMQYYKNGKPCINEVGKEWYSAIDNFYKEDMKVIGNIHQNRNLLM